MKDEKEVKELVKKLVWWLNVMNKWATKMEEAASKGDYSEYLVYIFVIKYSTVRISQLSKKLWKVVQA